jgi:hypothetical protein
MHASPQMITSAIVHILYLVCSCPYLILLNFVSLNAPFFYYGSLFNSPWFVPIRTFTFRAYCREGISQNFSNVDHIPKCGINKLHADNNRVERLNGIIRERTTVVRAWKKHKTPLAEGQRIQYKAL